MEREGLHWISALPAQKVRIQSTLAAFLPLHKTGSNFLVQAWANRSLKATKAHSCGCVSTSLDTFMVSSGLRLKRIPSPRWENLHPPEHHSPRRCHCFHVPPAVNHREPAAG